MRHVNKVMALMIVLHTQQERVLVFTPAVVRKTVGWIFCAISAISGDISHSIFLDHWYL